MRTPKAYASESSSRRTGGIMYQAEHTHSKGRLPWLTAFFAAFMLAFAACGATNSVTDAASAASDVSDAVDDSAEVSTGGFDEDEVMEDDDAMEEEEAFADDSRATTDSSEVSTSEEPDTASQPVPQTLTAADIGRQIIFTANVRVEVDDVASAGAEASSIIEELGGFVFGQNTIGGPNAESTITFKVLPSDFGTALERLGGIGELQSQQITTDDVTERIVDLQSRIDVAELGVERLRTAMEEAATLTDFAELEALLLSRESDLEVMKGQLRTLQDRVDLATITLTLSQDTLVNEIVLTPSLYSGHDNGIGCPGERENISIEQGEPATLCIEVTNRGEQSLSGVQITDTVLGIDNDGFIEVFGTLDQLDPGQSAVVAHELIPERTVQLRLRASATPIGEDGVALTAQTVRQSASPRIPTFQPDEPESPPGFRNGFDAALGLLSVVWTILIVLTGFILPLLILLPIVWLVVKFASPLVANRKAKRAAKIEAQLARHRALDRQPPPPTGQNTSGQNTSGQNTSGQNTSEVESSGDD